MNLHEDKPLWAPSAERIAGANVTAFRLAAAQRWGVPLPDYDALYDWSVAHPEQFWVSVWEGDGIGSAALPVAIDARVAKGAVWIESGYEATAPMSPVARLAVVGA